ncbi:MAG TPA: hypothetical protein VME18_12160 [Acidobacteriaceae bacterium]|nr:hypothetical protein [Acidobacteriaceae bacterium]
MSWEKTALLIDLACGLFSCVAQGKGYPCQRYPFLALLLLMLAIDFMAATRKTGPVRAGGWVGVAYCALFLAPYSAWKASRHDGQYTGLVVALDQGLSKPVGQNLSGQVPCIDTVGAVITPSTISGSCSTRDFFTMSSCLGPHA